MANIALQDGKVVLKDGKVSCACCGGCDCDPPAKRYQISASWAATDSVYFPCFGFGDGAAIIGLTSDGYSVSAMGRCEAYDGVGDRTITRWDLYAQNWDAPYECSYLTNFIFSSDPVGTFPLIGGQLESCGYWSLTISEIPETP